MLFIKTKLNYLRTEKLGIMTQRPKLYILTNIPPGNKVGGWSGFCTFLIESIKSLYCNTEVIICPNKQISKLELIRHYFMKLVLGHGIVLVRSKKYSMQVAEFIDKKITCNNSRILGFGTQLTPYIKENNQITIITDALAENLKMAFHNISNSEQERLHEIDQCALANSKKLIVLTELVRQTAITKYHYPSDNVYKLGTFLFFDCIPDIILDDIVSPKYRLLFISMDWKRRNGNFAVKLFKSLLPHISGLELHISGQKPSNEVLLINGIVFHDIDKNTLDGQNKLINLYQSCDFLLSPALYDLGSTVVYEAGFFGVPTIARSGGGINENIKNSISGVLLPHESNIEDWKQAILSIYSDINFLNKLRKGVKEYVKDSVYVKDKARIVLDIIGLS